MILHGHGADRAGAEGLNGGIVDDVGGVVGPNHPEGSDGRHGRGAASWHGTPKDCDILVGEPGLVGQDLACVGRGSCIGPPSTQAEGCLVGAIAQGCQINRLQSSCV